MKNTWGVGSWDGGEREWGGGVISFNELRAEEGHTHKEMKHGGNQTVGLPAAVGARKVWRRRRLSGSAVGRLMLPWECVCVFFPPFFFRRN